MAESRGFLQQAEPQSLDADLQAVLSTWSEKAYDDHNMLLTLARRPAMLRMALGFVRTIYAESKIEPDLTEMLRIKLAWNNKCRH